jgi:hypothetical protein
MKDNQKEFTGKNISPAEEIFLKIDELYEEAKNWADGAEIENEEQHDAVEKIHKALHEAGKKAEELRVAEKQPLDEEIQKIQDKFNPYLQDTKAKKGKVVRGKAELKEVLAKWRQKVEAEKRAAAEKAAREAEEKRLAAEAAMQTSKGNLEAREEAEALLAEAKTAEKSASKTARQANEGLGLRTTYEPVLKDINAAVRHYWKMNPDAFRDLVCDLAAKDVRAGKRDIPGFTVETIKKAI